MRPRPLAGVQRTAAAAALMLVLLAVAASATGRGGGSPAPPGAGGLSTAGHHVLVVAVVVLFPILAVVGFVLLLYAQIMRRRERDPEVLRARRRARIAAYALLAVSLGLLAYRHPHLPGLLGLLHTSSGTGGQATARLHQPHHGGAISGSDWSAAAAIWALLAAAAVVAYVRVRGRRGGLRPSAPPKAPAAGDEDRLDAVRRERNPRRAVIAAYALMERLLARDGLARGPHEAPVEYLGRVTLHGHHGVASVHRLTVLFQRARFGHRPVDEEMRLRAIAAVEELDAGADGPA